MLMLGRPKNRTEIIGNLIIFDSWQISDIINFVIYKTLRKLEKEMENRFGFKF